MPPEPPLEPHSADLSAWSSAVSWGVGVGFVVDEWGDEIARGATDLGEGAVNIGRKAVDGVGDLLGS